MGEIRSSITGHIKLWGFLKNLFQQMDSVRIYVFMIETPCDNLVNTPTEASKNWFESRKLTSFSQYTWALKSNIKACIFEPSYCGMSDSLVHSEVFTITK